MGWCVGQSHEFVSFDEHFVAGEDGCVRSPFSDYGWFVASDVGLVHDVVVEEGEVVEHLECECCWECWFVVVVEQGASGEAHYWAQSFTSERHRVVDRFVEAEWLSSEVQLAESLFYFVTKCFY